VPLSQSLAVSAIGVKLLTDANAVFEMREETSGPLDEQLSNLVESSITAENLDKMILWFKLVFAYIWFKYQSYLNLNCSMINDDYEFDSSHGFRVVSRFPKGQATWSTSMQLGPFSRTRRIARI